MNNKKIKIGDLVHGKEGTTWEGHSEGKVLDIYRAGWETFAEISWATGDVGSWPVSELVRKGG